MVWFMAFKTNFNNISVISWRSVLLVEETSNVYNLKRLLLTLHVSTSNQHINTHTFSFKRHVLPILTAA